MNYNVGSPYIVHVYDYYLSFTLKRFANRRRSFVTVRSKYYFGLKLTTRWQHFDRLRFALINFGMTPTRLFRVFLNRCEFLQRWSGFPTKTTTRRLRSSIGPKPTAHGRSRRVAVVRVTGDSVPRKYRSIAPQADTLSLSLGGRPRRRTSATTGGAARRRWLITASTADPACIS